MICKKYRAENKEKIKKNLRNRRRKNLRWVFSLKENKECEYCGFSRHPAALVFHHIDRNAKIKSISYMAKHCFSRKHILEEIKKCVLICSSCHKIEHFKKGDKYNERFM